MSLSCSYPQGGDTNFAPLILPNGSVVAMWRHWGGGNGGSREFLATASDWRDPSTYVQHPTDAFPDLGAARATSRASRARALSSAGSVQPCELRPTLAIKIWRSS